MVKAEILYEDDEKINILLKETDRAFVNSIRRTLISDTPKMAIDTVKFAAAYGTWLKEYTGKEVFSLILPPNINTEVGKFKVNNSQIIEGKLGKNSFKNRSKGLIPIISIGSTNF